MQATNPPRNGRDIRGGEEMGGGREGSGGKIKSRAACAAFRGDRGGGDEASGQRSAVVVNESRNKGNSRRTHLWDTLERARRVQFECWM